MNCFGLVFIARQSRDIVSGCLWRLPGLLHVLALWFLPRDAMHKRGLCRHAMSVCLSVYVSVSHVRGSCQNE